MDQPNEMQACICHVTKNPEGKIISISPTNTLLDLKILSKRLLGLDENPKFLVHRGRVLGYKQGREAEDRKVFVRDLALGGAIPKIVVVGGVLDSIQENVASKEDEDIFEDKVEIEEENEPSSSNVNVSHGQPEDVRLCRICFSGAEPSNPLFRPCRCRGTVEFVHPACLNQWRASTRREDAVFACEMCLTPYRVDRLWLSDVLLHPQTPLIATLSLIFVSSLVLGALLKLIFWSLGQSHWIKMLLSNLDLFPQFGYRWKNWFRSVLFYKSLQGIIDLFLLGLVVLGFLSYLFGAIFGGSFLLLVRKKKIFSFFIFLLFSHC